MEAKSAGACLDLGSHGKLAVAALRCWMYCEETDHVRNLIEGLMGFCAWVGPD